ncbi:MAG: hypothetical protein NMK33_00835 [Candidatus Cardinium sp.]|uniref:hypothetical protein n=1 Tax=Cardinium endosymbiont of Dermatophagoides farinae TaxID=2597823 RepID=UPI001182066E|nr:hypothetical protein [Cardinium endosymbiont of Dermatophagoides farinae]TSJ81064.1 hypothetical protein FPG78_03505 [Cardinium endosymbiont of Dermatophagoides farinae]UWW97099.1 MAG: hypothetical protein NMK33_00835 [Candidatus Cardinium sp.]
MQKNSFQRAILHTILYFTLFCAIAAGCDWCKGSVNKSIHINTQQTPPVISGENVTSKETDPDDPTKESLDAAGKDKNNDKGEDDEEGQIDEEDVKKKIEELVEEEETVKKEKKDLESQLRNPNTVQDNPYGRWYSVPPSAPPFEPNPNLDPPPPYDLDPRNNIPTTSSNVCENCRKFNNHKFDNEDINDIFENPSTKLKIATLRLNLIYKTKEKLRFNWKKKRICYYKDKLKKYEDEKTKSEEEKEAIRMNPALCNMHKIQKLEDNFIEMNRINLKIQHIEGIISDIRKKKNNKVDASSNKPASLYLVQEYGYPEVNNNKGNLYPPLPDDDYR